MLQQDEPDDYVLATGETHSVREFVELRLRRDRPHDRVAGQGRRREGRRRRRRARSWSQIDPRYFRPTEVDLLLGDPTKARAKLGWKHKTTLPRAGDGDGARPICRSQRASAERRATMSRPTSCVYALQGQARLGRRPSRHGRVGAIVRRLGARGLRDPDASSAQRASICARQAEVEAWMRADAAATSCSSRRRRSAASSPTTRCPAEFLYDNLAIEANVIHAAHGAGRREAAVPRLVLHLPEARAAADARGRAADRPARADQRVVRDRQDRRHQALPGLSPAVRLRLHLGHADQPLRAGRQLRPASRATCCRR